MVMMWWTRLAFSSGESNTCDVGGEGDAGLITVDGSNYSTVGAAIAAADPGDTVYVCRGAYPVSALIPDAITLLAVDGPDHTRLDGFGRPGFGVLTVLVGSTVIDGFEIVAGDPGEPGILVNSGAEAQIWNDRVFGSADRGIVVGVGADAVLIGTEVFGNAGGGIQAFGDGVLGLEGSTVWGNFAEEGAGLWLDGGRLVVAGSVKGNSGTRGGGVFARGATLLVTEIAGNDAHDGGNVYVPVDGQATLSSCLVQSGFATRGGGVFLEPYTDKGTASLTLERSEVVDNVAEAEGGGVWNGGVSVQGDGESYVSCNEAPLGGGFFVDDRDFGLSPIEDLTISENTAEQGAGVYISSVLVAPTGLLNLQIVGNSASYAGGGVGMPILEEPQPGFAGSVMIDHSTVLEGNTAEIGAGLFAASRDVLVLGGAQIRGGIAGSGGGMYLERDAMVDLQAKTAVLSNEAGDGGGATVAGEGAKLFSNGADWGEGGNDNSPEDVHASSSYSYGTEVFECDRDGCTP